MQNEEKMRTNLKRNDSMAAILAIIGVIASYIE